MTVAPLSIQADKTDDNHACCRYVSDHKPINCNAARQRYTSDYLDVQLANNGHTSCQYTSCPGGGVYAYSHFMQQGLADGRVWHSELCKADGTDRDASTDENGQVHIAVDNGYTLTINGVEIGSSEDWTVTDSYAFVAPCDQVRPGFYGRVRCVSRYRCLF